MLYIFRKAFTRMEVSDTSRENGAAQPDVDGLLLHVVR